MGPLHEHANTLGSVLQSQPLFIGFTHVHVEPVTHPHTHDAEHPHSLVFTLGHAIGRTVAIKLLELDQVILLFVAFAGVTKATMLNCFPIPTFTDVVSRLIPVTGTVTCGVLSCKVRRSPIILPNPVQKSNPGFALYAPFEPTVISLNGNGKVADAV